MKNFIKSKLSLIIVLAISVLFTTLSVVFSVGKTIPSTSYKTGNLENRNYYSALAYQVEIPENHMLDSIWINLASTDETVRKVDDQFQYEEYVEIYVGRAKKIDDNFSYLSNKGQDDAAKSFKVENNQDGVKVGQWQKIYDYCTPTDATYYIIATLNAVEINEIAFVGVEKDGTDGAYKSEKVLLTATALGSGAKGIKGDSSITWSKSLNDRANTLDKSEAGILEATRLIDEQSSFNPENIIDGIYVEEKPLTKKELNLAKVINSMYSDTAEMTDNTENPLGLILVSLSTMIFGTTTFTLRLVPIIFAIGSIILAYFIANKLIKNKYVCAGVSALFAVANLFIVVSTAFTWSIGIFFILLSIYFVLGYALTKKIKSNNFILYLISGGLSYALAISVRTMFIFALPVLLALIGYTVYARYVKLTKKIKDGNVRVAKFNMYREIICAFIGFVLIPIIVLSVSFVIVAPSLTHVYQTSGIFNIISKHFFGAF